MKTISLIVFIAFFSLFYSDAVAQIGYADKINQVDDKSPKEGFWKENINKRYHTETYYHRK